MKFCACRHLRYTATSEKNINLKVHRFYSNFNGRNKTFENIKLVSSHFSSSFSSSFFSFSSFSSSRISVSSKFSAMNEGNVETPVMSEETKRTEGGDEMTEKLSAAERRRRRKAEQKEAKQATKSKAVVDVGDNEGSASNLLKSRSEEEELNPTLYFENRSKVVGELQGKGICLYPHKYPVDISCPEFVEKYNSLEDGEHREDVEVCIAGRVMRMAASGPKLLFYHLRSNGAKIQLMCNISDHDNSTGDFFEVHDRIRRGDILGVRGYPGKSKRGELSVFPREVQILSPCLRMLPDRKLIDPEIRYRQRYLDMIVNDDTRKTFVTRAAIVSYIRSFLETRGFLEVETPMMNMIPGGAAARPFLTHHNDLDMDLYMRVAPELYLKMLIVGGMDKVFEIGKNFRNEGIDMTHNPEFTACEFYWAYADFYDLMDFTEEMLCGLVKKLKGSYLLSYHPDGPEGEEVMVDFTPPFPRVSMVEEIEKSAGVLLPRPFDSVECVEMMMSLIRKHDFEMPNPPTPGKLLDQLCGHFVEGTIKRRPTFIIEHPQIMSPLAKWHRSKAELTERFELFILGKEVCNAYTELNDPKRQRECFVDQAKAKMAGDDEACAIDEVFCTSLEHGFPPTAGWGLGIDRMTMFLTDKNNIKEIILFPAMRPSASVTGKLAVGSANTNDSPATPTTTIPNNSSICSD